MRILSVRVKNFRMHEDRTIEFDRERTVVAGPNESGKSTLVDAIERVLCYPHRSNADNLESLKPRAGGGAPEVTLRFERHGRTYEIHKVFKGPQSVARLTDDTGGQYGGDDAEERLRALLGFGETSLRHAFRGWSHLWARQGQAGNDPTDGAVLGAAAKDLDARLKSMTGTMATESPRDTATFDRIAAEYDATFTTKGDPKSTSSLFAVLKELNAAREAATQAAARLAEFETAADTVVREDALIQESRTACADAERQLADIRTKLVEIEDHERTLATQTEDLKAVVAVHAELKNGDAEIEELTQSIDTRTKVLAPKESEIQRLRVHEQRLQATVAACLTAIERSNESQRAVAAREDLLKAVSKVFGFASAQADLEGTLQQIKTHQAAIAAIDDRLHNLPELDKNAVDALEDLDRQLEVGQGKLAASSTRIEVLEAGAEVIVDGRPLAALEAKTLSDPTDVTIGERTHLRVIPGGGESLFELRAEVAQVKKDLAAGLDGVGLKNVAEARATLEERLSEEASRERLQEKIVDLDGDDVHGRLNGIKADIQKLEAEIERKRPEGFERPSDAAAVDAAIGGLEERRSQADEAVRHAHADFNKVTGDFNQTQQTREDLEKDLATERRELRDLDVQKAALERVHGTDRQAKLSQLADDKAAKQDAVAATERRLKALHPGTVRADKERYEQTFKVATDQIIEAGKRKANAEGRLSNGGTIDLHGVKAAGDARLDIASRRHAEVFQRAQAVRRLKELFEKQRQAVAEVVAAPLRAKVTEYLDALFGTASRVTVTKAGETFEDLKVTRQSVGGLEFEFDELSGGTKEQVAAACRLAMAEVLAGGTSGEGMAVPACLPMVFDDAFVNSDPERIKAVQRVLYLGARRGLQIIVLSCTPQEYSSFAAKRVDLPPVRHTAATIASTADENPPAELAQAANGGEDTDDSADSMAPPGQVPSGDDESLASALLSALASMPERKAGNGALRSQLGWDESTYERTRDRLVAAGRIEKGRGRGGSIRLPESG